MDETGAAAPSRLATPGRRGKAAADVRLERVGTVDDLPEATRVAIHEVPTVDSMLSSDVSAMTRNPVLTESLTWSGPIDGVIHPDSNHLKDPTMVFRYDADHPYGGHFVMSAAVRYTHRSSGIQEDLDDWSFLLFRDGQIRDWVAKDGPGHEGLDARFYGDDDENFLAGTVRNERIIGTFVTDTGR